MLTVPQAIELLQAFADQGVTEGFLAVRLMDDTVCAITGFELVDDWCLVNTEAEVGLG